VLNSAIGGRNSQMLSRASLSLLKTGGPDRAMDPSLSGRQFAGHGRGGVGRTFFHLFPTGTPFIETEQLRPLPRISITRLDDSGIGGLF
jgi:hypothetical protein